MFLHLLKNETIKIFQMKEMKAGVKNVSENNQKLLSQVEKYRFDFVENTIFFYILLSTYLLFYKQKFLTEIKK